MARKRYSDEDALKLLPEIDVHLHDGLDVVGACRKAGISDVRRQGFWNQRRPKLRESLAHLFGFVRRVCVDASVALRVFSV